MVTPARVEGVETMAHGLLYFTAVKRTSGLPVYYVKKGVFSIAPHQAAMMTEDVAKRVCKRYSLTLERDYGYDVAYRAWEDLGEVESCLAIRQVIQTAKADGLSDQEIVALVAQTLESKS